MLLRPSALVAVLLVLWAAIAPPATAGPTTPARAQTAPATLSASASQARWGESVGVDGTGWAPGTTVDLSLLPDTIVLGRAEVAEDGTFGGTVTIPEVQAGTHYQLVATGQGADGFFAFVPVSLTIVGPGAVMSVDAETLGWEETTVVRGELFLPSSTAQVHLMPQNQLLAEAVVRADRGFEVVVRIPSDLASSRDYQLVVTGAAADGQLTFLGTPITIIGPQPAIEVAEVAGPSRTVEVRGLRFRPGTQAVVTLLPGSQRLGEAAVGDDRTFTLQVPLPDEAAAGGVLAVTGEGADHLFAYLVWEIAPLTGGPVVVDPTALGSTILPPRARDDAPRSGPALRLSLSSLLDTLRPVEPRVDAESGEDVVLALLLLVLAVVGSWTLYHGLRSDLGPAVARLVPGRRGR